MKRKKKEEDKRFANEVHEAAVVLVKEFLIPGIKLMLTQELSKIHDFDNKIKMVDLRADALEVSIVSVEKSILKLEGKTGQEILRRILKETQE